MKNILFLLVLLPTLAFSQVSSWRQTGGSVPASSQTSQSTQTRVQPSIPQQNNVSNWRNNPPQQSQPLPPRGRGGIQNWNGPNQFGYYWGNWGWYQPFPYIWYDDFGWRQRSVIHIYESGKRDTIRKEHTIYLGGGKRIDKLGVHGMIGFGNEILRYQGRDALGGISFPKSNTNFTTFKIGLIRDFKWFTLKLDTDPIRKYSQISIGLNNK